jgi:hypothetical protein
MLATSAPQVLPPAWQHVLEQIEASLAQTLRELHEREQALSISADSGRDAVWNDALARLGDRLAALDDCAGRAGRAVAAADEVLAQTAADIQQWRTAAERTRTSVADGADGAVS